MTDVLKEAIAASGVSLYQIAKEAEIVKTSLSRFMRGETSLRLDKAERIAAYLGLRLVRDPDAVPPEPTPPNLARPMLAKKRRTKPRRKGK